MCRIAAIISKNNFALQQRVVAMSNAMQHGGPDDEGCVVNESMGYALAHKRLSIIDLSSNAHQPMIDEANEIEIIFNGEIYNYKELQNELKALNYQFFSNSDTEVLIKAYKHWGTSMLQKLKGMFAFIIIDKKSNQLFAARDHAGIKPLYFGRKNDELLFASEIKAFTAVEPNWKENENWKIWFLTFGFLPEPVTTLQNVEPLPRGHYMLVDLNTQQQQVKLYYQYSYENNTPDYTTAVSTTRKLVEQAVTRHLIADVPVGVFLSGGIDSSILAILAQQQNSSPIETISIYFDDEKYSEKEYQELIIKQTGVKHHLYKITKQEFLDSWDDIYKSLDQPSTDAINTYFICKYAKQIGLKVVLSGLGADEIFGGYPSIRRAEKYNKYKRLAVLTKLLPSWCNSSYPNKKLDFLKKNIDASEYLLYRGLFTPKDVASILNITQQQVWQVIGNYKFDNTVKNLLPQNRATYYETTVYMQSQLLKDSDMQSMWHSLELRVPFLDIDLINYVNNLHPCIKFNNKVDKPKPLLVDAFIQELPNKIWNRPKQGFTFPFENWFTTMNVFKNVNLVPQWIFKLFMQRKLNFARLWSVFLINASQQSDVVDVIN